ncbi:MAG: hypothetical protein WCK90_04600, partial [archaeon]
FTTSATPSTDSGSPGGGSSTPTTQTWKYTYPNNNAELSVKGTVVQGMYLKERTQLKVSGEAHYVGIVGLTSTQATINVSSTSQQAVFNIGDSKRFEVTNDNFYDLKVVLVGIKDNKANVTIEYIHEAMPASAAPAANTTANNNANVTNTLTSNQQKASAWYSNLTFNSKIIYGIVIGLLVILGIVGIVYYIIKQRKMQGY